MISQLTSFIPHPSSLLPPLLAQRTYWLEPPASTGAVTHDLVFDVLLYTMTFFFFLVIGIMLFLVVLYRRRKGQHPEDGPTHNTPLEISWTLIPLVIVTGFFVIGLKYYVDIEVPPAGAEIVDVEARQWGFKFKYPNGGESEELYLQKDRPVLLRLTSVDVTHALYIPAFRVQRNAVPGQTTEIWFTPTLLSTKDPTTDQVPANGEEGYYNVFCTQYCGLNHADMHAKAFVLTEKDYKEKLAAAANIFVDKNTRQPLPYAKVGEKLYTMSGCAQCHSVDGAKGTGPTWKGLYKSDVEFTKAEPGYTLSKTDNDAKWDAYLRESILHPEVKIVKGLDASGNLFENKMPPQESSFSGSPYNEKKLQAIIEYIKSLGEDYDPKKSPELQNTLKPGEGPRPAAETPNAKTPASEKSPKSDRLSDRPADPPIDKSSAPAPAQQKDERK
jgi:cytochrome c oxidase subunit II